MRTERVQRFFSLKIIRFSMVGALGFIVDALVLQLLISIFKMDLYLSQVIAFLAAASVTWHFNRTFTFKHVDADNKKRQWGLYLLLNIVGGVINYSAYAFSITEFPLTHRLPVLALAVGSVAGLAFNFVASKYIVFRTRNISTALKD